jgi:DNA-binding SARP family transcriptional activator/tetratricopeptide (TPR) repeat protein
MSAGSVRGVLELRLLGTLEARRGGEPVMLGGAKPRALLADLLVHLGTPVSVDRLIDDLWGERPPASAGHAIEVYVSQLRKALDPERVGLLASSSGGYSLEIDPDSVDAPRFEGLLDEGRSALAVGEPSRANALLLEGLRLWRGPALADLAYEPFAQTEIARLEELRVAAVEARIEAELALGQAAELVGELEALVAAHPFRERLLAQLMLALYRSGRQADALGAFRSARQTLVDELGVEPGPELRALESAILRQDDSLLLSAPPAKRVAPRREQRRLATILFVETEWSGVGRATDPEALGRAMQREFALASAVLTEHGGTLQRLAGGGVMAAFGIPAAHEDDALRAARGALELRASLAALNDELTRDLGLRLVVRIGLSTGEVVEGQGFLAGEAVAVATALQRAAAAGEIAVGLLTQRLLAHAAGLEPLGELELPGGPAPAFRLVDVAAGSQAVPRRLDAPLVGRERELTLLGDSFDLAVGRRCVRAVTVIGPAGIGKSRLVGEFGASRGEGVIVLTGRCLPYGAGITLWPLRMIVRQAAGDESREAIVDVLAGESEAEAAADVLAAALASRASAPATIAWAFRLFCEALARRRPLVLVLEDLHWAEAAFLDLIESLVDRSRDAPIVVLGVAREELLEGRPGFLSERERAETLGLERLADQESDALSETLCNEAGLSAGTRRRIAESAEGNPLFLEQLVALAAEEGGLEVGESLPASIQALLLARLDRLGPGERAVLECAAVVGKEFPERAVAELVEPAAAASLGRLLRTLVRRGFTQPVAARVPFEETFRFRHALIQAAAYGATPKAERAVLHERLAGWLESRPSAQVPELDALLGYHVEQAYRYTVELGPADAHALELALSAGARLGAAGTGAWKRGDARATTNLLGRATALLPEDDPVRSELLCELGVALGVAGESTRGQDVLQQAAELSASQGDRRIELRGRVELSYLRLLDRPREGADELLAAASEAIPLLGELGDDRGLGRAWLLSGFVQGGVRGQHAAWLEAAERALVHHDRAGWPVAACVGQIAAALYYGPTSVREAIARCRQLESAAADDRGAEANVGVFLGGLEAQRGNFDLGRELVLGARAVFDDLGYARLSASHCGAVAGEIALVAGDPVAAETVLRATCEVLREMHELSNFATRAADLAEALYAQGRYEEAEVWARTSATSAGDDDLTAQPAWRSVRAKVLARRGAFEEAERLSREAVRIAVGTDALNQRAKLQADLGEVLSLAGRPDEAASQLGEALQLYELKGNTPGVDKVRALLDRAPVA